MKFKMNANKQTLLDRKKRNIDVEMDGKSDNAKRKKKEKENGRCFHDIERGFDFIINTAIGELNSIQSDVGWRNQIIHWEIRFIRYHFWFGFAGSVFSSSF